MKFLITDVNGFVGLSKRLAVRLAQIAHQLGYQKAEPRRIMFCGGGTDAAESSRVGIESTTLIGLPYGKEDARGRANVYHTPRDTIDSVEPEIVQATIEILIKFVEQLENCQFP